MWEGLSPATVMAGLVPVISIGEASPLSAGPFTQTLLDAPETRRHRLRMCWRDREAASLNIGDNTEIYLAFAAVLDEMVPFLWGVRNR